MKMLDVAACICNSSTQIARWEAETGELAGSSMVREPKYGEQKEEGPLPHQSGRGELIAHSCPQPLQACCGGTRALPHANTNKYINYIRTMCANYI